jgi:hypothetical protein
MENSKLWMHQKHESERPCGAHDLTRWPIKEQ